LVERAVADNQRSVIYFPVIERYEPEGGIGFLEIIQVKITDGENKFIVEPYQSENDATVTKADAYLLGKCNSILPTVY